MVKDDLSSLVVKALKYYGGSASIVQIAEYIWDNFEQDLRKSGRLFYTWQYDMRWAANKLRRLEVMKQAEDSSSGIWELELSKES